MYNMYMYMYVMYVYNTYVHVPCKAWEANLTAMSLEHFKSPLMTLCFNCRKYKYLEKWRNNNNNNYAIGFILVN